MGVFFKWRRLLLAAALGCGALGTGALAQEAWPSKPIRLVVPIGPGGGTDIGGRIVARKLSERLGQQVVVDNRPGANGVVGTLAVSQAAADGYTLLYAPAGFAASPALVKSLPFDIFKDFEPISLAARLNLVIVASPNVPAATLPEFIAYSKANPGKLNYASTTAAVTLMVEHFKNITGADITPVTYRGGPNAWTDFIGGRLDVIFEVPAMASTQLKAGHGRALAVTGGTRAAELPAVQTVAELGYKNYEVYTWQALFARAGTPPEVLRKLKQAFAAVMADPEVREQLTKVGLEPVGSSDAELAALVKREATNWVAVARRAKIEPQ
jgi:tripartite-type tricarboxylate transporter receptor subunit TctC